MTSIADNLRKVRQRIQIATAESGRAPESVALLAVSKTQPVERVRQAAQAGAWQFGENYVQEALEKIPALGDLTHLEWHFIGPIQSNKTRDIATHFDWVHSIDREKVARRLNEQRAVDLPPLNVCIQVNLDDEASKAGTSPAEVITLAKAIMPLPRLRLRGLMAIPDPANPPDTQRLRFRALAGLLSDLKTLYPESSDLDTLSMGMSGDLELAIGQGATMVRVGTALFGPRG